MLSFYSMSVSSVSTFLILLYEIILFIKSIKYKSQTFLFINEEIVTATQIMKYIINNRQRIPNNNKNLYVVQVMKSRVE